MRISEAYPSKYLKAADLDGQDRAVSIRACIQEELGQGAEMETKPVLYFDGGQKGLVLNKTNAQAIADDYGDDTEAWAGREIVLFIQKVTFQGKLTPAIRVAGVTVGNQASLYQTGWSLPARLAATSGRIIAYERKVART